MLKSEDGKVQMHGDAATLFTDFAFLARSLINEFSLDDVMTAMSVAVLIPKEMEENRVYMSDLQTLLNKLNEGEK